MTNQEVNKIISEYMGKTFVPFGKDNSMVYSANGSLMPKQYTKSLDALVPVWEKLNWIHIDFEPHDGGKVLIHTIQEYSAYATAKAIKELNE